MTATPNLASQAEEFFSSTWEVICRVLPVGDAEPTVVINEDADHMVAEFQIPLAFSGPALAQDGNPESFSAMFWAVIRYDMCPDRTGKELAVRSSKFELRVHTAPGIRFEYERDNTSAPRSHVHYSGMGGLLSTAIMRFFRPQAGTHRPGATKAGDVRLSQRPQRLADGVLASRGIPGDAGGLAVAVGVDDGDAAGAPSTPWDARDRVGEGAPGSSCRRSSPSPA